MRLIFRPRGVACEIDFPLPAPHPAAGLHHADPSLKGWPIGGPGP